MISGGCILRCYDYGVSVNIRHTETSIKLWTTKCELYSDF